MPSLVRSPRCFAASGARVSSSLASLVARRGRYSYPGIPRLALGRLNVFISTILRVASSEISTARKHSEDLSTLRNCAFPPGEYPWLIRVPQPPWVSSPSFRLTRPRTPISLTLTSCPARSRGLSFWTTLEASGKTRISKSPWASLRFRNFRDLPLSPPPHLTPLKNPALGTHLHEICSG